MSQNAPLPTATTPEPGVTTCANCHSPMPNGLRFCRNCGFRLGEGLAEYTETVRFQNGAGPRNAIPYSAPYGDPRIVPGAACGPLIRRRKAFSGTTWIFVALIVFFTGAFGLSRLSKQRFRPPILPHVERSYLGVNSFDTARGGAGVTFDDVEPPGSPADKAGLVGGDIITIFDGQRLESDEQLTHLLESTPIGKTVDVVFIRDGESKTTKLTTISKGDLNQLAAMFSSRPEGRGFLGIVDQKEVEIPGTNIRGVRFDVQSSRPADMAGLRNGDIIVSWGSVPIRTEGELRTRIERSAPYSTVEIEMVRGTERGKMTIKIGRK